MSFRKSLSALVFMAGLISACSKDSKSSAPATGQTVTPPPSCVNNTDECNYINAHNLTRATASPTPPPG